MPKLLNELKNHEIYPFLWNQPHSVPIEFKFLDLKKVQNYLDQNPIEENELENLIYGKPEQKYYSGWTETIFKKIANDCSLNILDIQTDQKFYTKVRVRINPKTNASKFHFLNERLYERIWEKRKNLRKKTKQTKAFIKSIFHKPLSKDSIWLNLGAGEETYPNYVKVDLEGEQDVFDNIVTLKKIPNASVERIYTNHVLEHIPVFLIQPMLKRWHEVLKQNGKILARIPNAKASITALNREWKEATKEEVKTKDLPPYLDKENALEGVLDDISCIQAIYGWSSSTKHVWNLSNQHKSLWTPTLARKHFETAGFKVVEAQPFGTLQTLVVAEK